MRSHIRHVLTILAVTDLDASVAFYRRAFDWTPDIETPVYVEFALADDQRIGLYEREAFGQNTDQTPIKVPSGELAPSELYFYVDDLVSAAERLESAGARVLSKRASRLWGDEAAYFADPDGHVLVVARPLHPED